MPEEKTFNLAIIGGGIAGAGIARDAALRGIKTVLFEKNTFGSGTSSKSSKLIHGGIRYLETAWKKACKGDLPSAWKNFRFVFLSLKESRILARIAPDLVQPIALVIPLYRGRGRHVWVTMLGTLAYALLAQLSGKGHFPHFFHSADSILKLLPDLNPEKLAGGVMIWDHWTPDIRLVQATMQSGIRDGAQAFEHATVTHYAFESGENRYRIQVERGGKEEIYFARKLVNASGAWVDKVREKAGEKKGDFILPVAGSHVTLKKFTDHSLILEAEDGRIFFVINIGDRARIGTTERLHPNPDHVEITPQEMEYLLEELNRHFPKKNFKKEDIVSHDAGIRPLARPENPESSHDTSREHEIRVGPTGVLHLLGVKLTDHRRAAEEVVDRLVPDLLRFNSKIRPHCLTSKTML